MSVPAEDEENRVVANATTTGLIDDDHLDAQKRHQRDVVGGEDSALYVEASEDYTDDDVLQTSDQHQCFCRYLPNMLKKKCKGSIKLAFLSHTCFITASLFYLRLSFVDLSWVQATIDNNVPSDVLDEDDDEVWFDWANKNENGSVIEDMRTWYDTQYKLLYTLGATFFVFVGILDLMRYCDVLNIFMILAGAAGVASGLCDTKRWEVIWDLVSVHLYLLEAYNLFHREHNHVSEGRVSFFRVADVCFFLGSMLDVIGSWLGLAGQEGIWVVQMGIFAAFLWLACSFIDLDAEIFFLGRGGILCY